MTLDIDRALREHLPMMTRLVQRMVRNPAEAEDVLQNACAGAVRSAPQFRGDAQVSTWLAQIAMRQVQDHWRSKARKPAIATDPAALADVVLDDIDVGAQAEARRKLARLYELLETIAPNKRMAFVLHVIEGKPVAEVAKIMSATEVGTRTRVMWARRALMAKCKRDPLLAELIA